MRNCPNSLVALFQSGNIPHRLRSPQIYIQLPQNFTCKVKASTVMSSVGRGVIDGRLYIGQHLVGPGRRALLMRVTTVCVAQSRLSQTASHSFTFPLQSFLFQPNAAYKCLSVSIQPSVKEMQEEVESEKKILESAAEQNSPNLVSTILSPPGFCHVFCLCIRGVMYEKVVVFAGF